MTEEERIVYLSNLVHVAGADEAVSRREGEVIERVREEMGAGREEMARALQAVTQGEHTVRPVGRFSEKVRNLEDMILVAVCDDRFTGEEKPEVVAFAKDVGVTQAQLNVILAEARERSHCQEEVGVCPSCGKEIPPGSRFCPGCGADLRSGPGAA